MCGQDSCGYVYQDIPWIDARRDIISKILNLGSMSNVTGIIPMQVEEVNQLQLIRYMS